MKIRQPSYYQKFQCIGSRCEDNCCIGWEIDIDADTLRHYQSFSGEWKERFEHSVSLDGTPHFILHEDRCPFLNEQNLCDIISAFGEENLCEICSEHPRFHQWLPGLREDGLGLCCEAAGELIFEKEEPLSFLLCETEGESREEAEDPIIEILLTARERAFSLLQNRNYSIEERLALLLSFGEDLQDCLTMEQTSALLSVIREYESPDFLSTLLQELKTPPEEPADHLSLFTELLYALDSLEPIDEAWPVVLKELMAALPQLLKNREAFRQYYEPKSYEYEHLAVYYTYRYFMDAAFDGDLLSKVKLTLISFLANLLLDTGRWLTQGELTFRDRIEISKSYSKEVEYSQENLKTLMEKSWESSAFEFSSLLSLLLDPFIDKTR